MKNRFLLLAASLVSAAAMHAQDLAPGINYSYNPPGANGIITNITVDVVNNDNTAAGSFDVAMYLYDQNTTNYWIIGTTNVPGLSGNALITISNWNIDINNTPNIPAGTYRLGVWVDSNNDISEANENDNSGLLSGNINYSPSASGIAVPALSASAVKCLSNPANTEAIIAFSLRETAAVTLQLYDMTGRLVLMELNEECLTAGEHKVKLETATLPGGVYFWTVQSGETKVSGRLVVSH